MKRMPEKPLHFGAQDKKEAWAFFGTMLVVGFFTQTIVGVAFPGDNVLSRVMKGLCVIGSVAFASAVKTRMEKEHAEKVRVWLNFWDEYKEDMDRLKMEMYAEQDECVKETLKIKLSTMQQFYNDNFC